MTADSLVSVLKGEGHERVKVLLQDHDVCNVQSRCDLLGQQGDEARLQQVELYAQCEPCLQTVSLAMKMPLVSSQKHSISHLVHHLSCLPADDVEHIPSDTDCKWHAGWWVRYGRALVRKTGVLQTYPAHD